MTSASTSPWCGWQNAFGSVPTTVNPMLFHKWTARVFVLTTKLNCIAPKAPCARAAERVFAQAARHSAAGRFFRYHIAAIGDMRPAAELVGAQVIKTEQLPLIDGDIGFAIVGEKIRQRVLSRHAARQRVGFAGANDGLHDIPDIGCIIGAGESDGHCISSLAALIPNLSA